MPYARKKPAPRAAVKSRDARPVRRRGVNLTIPEDVIAEAKALKLNASQAAEAGIRAAIARAREEEWRREAAPAIEAHNERILSRGTHLKPLWARSRGGRIGEV